MKKMHLRFRSEHCKFFGALDMVYHETSLVLVESAADFINFEELMVLPRNALSSSLSIYGFGFCVLDLFISLKGPLTTFIYLI